MRPPRGDGALQVNEGWRTLPYLAEGSAGIGLVLAATWPAAPTTSSPTRWRRSPGRRAPFYVQSGLFNGRAGMVLYLADTGRAAARDGPGCQRGRRPPSRRRWRAARADRVGPAGRPVRRLSWHALSHGGHLAFPGDQLLRLSMDLATGSAGVLLALGAALHDKTVHLPLLGPVPTTDEREEGR